MDKDTIDNGSDICAFGDIDTLRNGSHNCAFGDIDALLNKEYEDIAKELQEINYPLYVIRDLIKSYKILGYAPFAEIKEEDKQGEPLDKTKTFIRLDDKGIPDSEYQFFHQYLYEQTKD